MHCTGGNVHNLPKVIITKYYKQKAYSDGLLQYYGYLDISYKCRKKDRER